MANVQVAEGACEPNNERRGMIQLIDPDDFYRKMRKSLNNQRQEISDKQIAEITRIYGNFKTYGEYIEGIAQQHAMQSARRLKPYPFTYATIQMMLKDGGVCGTMGRDRSPICGNSAVSVSMKSSYSSRHCHRTA